MLRALSVVSLLALLAGCSHRTGELVHPQINRAAKADKYVAPKTVKIAPAEPTTPNQIVKKRWYDRFLKHKSKS